MQKNRRGHPAAVRAKPSGSMRKKNRKGWSADGRKTIRVMSEEPPEPAGERIGSPV